MILLGQNLGYRCQLIQQLVRNNEKNRVKEVVNLFQLLQLAAW